MKKIQITQSHLRPLIGIFVFVVFYFVSISSCFAKQNLALEELIQMSPTWYEQKDRAVHKISLKSKKSSLEAEKELLLKVVQEAKVTYSKELKFISDFQKTEKEKDLTLKKLARNISDLVARIISKIDQPSSAT